MRLYKQCENLNHGACKGGVVLYPIITYSYQNPAHNTVNQEIFIQEFFCICNFHGFFFFVLEANVKMHFQVY